MVIRSYRTGDCECLAELFYETVHAVNRKDYTAEQLAVWAAGSVDLEAWDRSFMEHETVVVEEDGLIVGFGDMDRNGYLDRLFVHKDYQNRGIAAAICDELGQSFKGRRITTQASITARPFFEHRGYRVVKEQQVVRDGISLTNFLMCYEKGIGA